MTALRMVLLVTVGLARDMPIPEKCRQWKYTSDDYAVDEQASNFAAMCDEASEYAREQMDPTQHNFVRLEWVWL